MTPTMQSTCIERIVEYAARWRRNSRRCIVLLSAAVVLALQVVVVGPAWAQAPGSPQLADSSAPNTNTEPPNPETNTNTETNADASTLSIADSETVPASRSQAWYQGVSAERQARARELYRQAVTLHQELRFVEAIARYELALRDWEHPNIRFALARAVLKTGRALDAWQHLQQVWQWGPDALVGQNRELAHELQQTLLREHLAEVEVRCDQFGVEIELNGKPLVRGPGVGRRVVEPGEHVLSASKDGYSSLVRTILALASKRVEVEVQLSPDLIDKHPRWSPWKPWAVAGAGAVIGLVGVGLRLDGVRRVDEAVDSISAECADVCDRRSSRDYDRAKLRSDVGLGTIIAGSAVMATGLALVLLNRPRATRSEDRSRAPFEMTPIITPSVSRDGAGVSLQIRF